MSEQRRFALAHAEHSKGISEVMLNIWTVERHGLARVFLQRRAIDFHGSTEQIRTVLIFFREHSKRIAEILQAVQILVNNPLMGRPVRGGKRELVIGRGARGYVALYRYVPKIDTVFLLAVRSQREAGYKRGS